MKNLFLKTIAIALFLLVIPTKQYGQSIKNHVIELEVESIINSDYRYCLFSRIANDTNIEYTINEEDMSVQMFSAKHWSDTDFQSYYDELLAETKNTFNTIQSADKETQGNAFTSWKESLPQDLFVLLFKQMLIENPNSRDGNQHCVDSDPFCTTDIVTFHVDGSVSGVCESGPNYGCMSPYSQRPPFWFHMKIGVAGTFTIRITNSNNLDLDFCAWGPFTDPVAPCPYQLTSDKIIDCDSPSNTVQECTIPSSSQVGQYYILVITKYTSGSTNITFQKQAGSGPGETDCGILPGIASNDGPYCLGDAIHLTVNAQEGATYSWSGPGGFTSNQQNPTRPNSTMAMAGTYTCVTTVGTHSVTATTDVVILARPTANFTASATCKGEATQFNNTSTTNPAGQTISSYLWNFGDGQTSTQRSPSHTYANAGNYNVTLTTSIESGDFACTSTKTQNVTVLAQPIANAGNDTTIIYNASAQLNGSGGAGSFLYQWSPANLVVNPNAQHTQTRPLTDQQTFTLTVTNPQGDCEDSDEITVYIEGSNMTLSPTASPAAICLGEESSQLNAHAGGGSGNFTYSWTPTTGLSNPTSATPIATPTSTTTYTCTATDGYSTLSNSVTVTVNHPETTEETVYICADDTYTWHGETYSAEGNYQFDTLTAQGCSKSITLHLHHYPTYPSAHTTTEYICAGESYNFHGTEYSTPGLYSKHFQTIHGCDSTVWLNLNVYPENPITVDSVTVCPEQLPFYYYGEEFDHEVNVVFTDHDVHGCDSLVRLVLTISDYYIPEIEHQYICYDDTPSFTWWNVNNQTYTEEGFYIDTIPTQYCNGIFRLDLHFLKTPDPIILKDTACDHFTWNISNTSYDFDIPNGSYNHDFVKSHFDLIEPYHYDDAAQTPCRQETKLFLKMYKISDHEADVHVNGECDSYTWYFGFNGESETYTVNGEWTKRLKSKLSNSYCDSIVTLRITNMLYSPNPDKIRSTDATAVVFGAHNALADTVAVITNTEFFSFIYDFYVSDLGPSVWDGCIWEKPSWATDWTIEPYAPAGETIKKCCKVLVGQHYDNDVVLSCKIWNSCMPAGDTIVKKIYLKSSFFGVDEYGYPEDDANVVITPNPTNGQLRIGFENMGGRVDIKVYDMSGHLIDNFETNVFTNDQYYEYNMSRHGEGVYCFVISDNKHFITRKVILIR